MTRGRAICQAMAVLALALAKQPGILAAPPEQVARWLRPQAWVKDTTGPVLGLGEPGAFDDRHLFAPAVAYEEGAYRLWYCGSRGANNRRVFRLGMATSKDGRHFEKYAGNPVLEFADGVQSILTPTLLRDGNGQALREAGQWRIWFASTAFGKSRLHQLHESASEDGIHWQEPSAPLAEHVYCPTVLKTGETYQMWFSDVRTRPWVLRHATSVDGHRWTFTPQPVLRLSQEWEAEVLVYPTVLWVDGVYLMWYGSYDHAVRRETTAIGFAASADGVRWYKYAGNPVLRPDEDRAWESNYVGSGTVMRLPDGTFRYWYASRKRPPFENLYFAINTARWDPAGLPEETRSEP